MSDCVMIESHLPGINDNRQMSDCVMIESHLPGRHKD